uniref:Small ribosomal subunit protein eS19 n=2 Tax=Polytomella TaxID=3049 RepID=A0A7S0UYS0_9CHLO|nr:40S ribosomal protein S19 (RPS19) [Polytomella parva]CBU30416.1 40S ribosomal protein S19 [Polytomella sp. Pringsheim 198.80]|mmetsp:Transcript_18702/g.33944  ORF Transcript_18702/g.33944 Transcript_18702/m.33944 type:complete len:143 (+) Transcript_18702:89-517(+)|eukprot:CAMPEP_0175038692 /NCGR_PEP_ID=MMETSP0052_2-20121109/17_1 /TAXON_ID=51329 ORGANISM="Polytomella parva, Strain SAG 63-3" /NCGR_SAMPLE_ID=MMETSP0052_2 /ASSEMBLY_ACC=CAM_ASM_000194 /LENGTH=142 /DNA_ID=CAMNT_0016300157 /DNA_START=74 /DNA_END=502 /DNA_ORIENTATION=-
MAEYKPKSVKDVSAEAFIKAYAAHLKNNDKIQLPSWVDVVKTGKHKELSPYNPDWYYVRAASVARKLYFRQGMGVGLFRTVYGGNYKRRGVIPEKHSKAAGGLVRHILHQLEEVGLVEKADKGRRVTDNGQRDMDQIAGRIL